MENGKGAVATDLTNGIGMGSTEFHVLRPIDGVSNPYWLLCLTRMRIFRKLAEKNMSGTGGQKRVGAAFLENFMIGLPPIDKQNAFESIYKQADKSKFVGFKSQFIEMFGGAPKASINTMVDTVWGSSPDSNTYNNVGDGVPFYQGKTEFGDLYIKSPTTHCTAPIKMAKQNAILMSVRAPVGAVNIATQDCCIGRGLAAITPKEGKSTTMFVYYALKYMETEIERLGTGSTFKAINKDSYDKISMPNVGINCQMAFVKIAEQADKSKFELQQAIDKIDKVMKSLLQ